MRRKIQIWSHLLKKSLMENFIFCAGFVFQNIYIYLSKKRKVKTFIFLDNAIVHKSDKHRKGRLNDKFLK